MKKKECIVIKNFENLDKDKYNDLYAIIKAISGKKIILWDGKSEITAYTKNKLELGILSTTQKIRLEFNNYWIIVACRELNDSEKSSISILPNNTKEENIKPKEESNKPKEESNKPKEENTDKAKKEKDEVNKEVNENKLIKIKDLKEKESATLFLKLKLDMTEEKTATLKPYVQVIATDGTEDITLKKWNTSFSDLAKDLDVTSGKIVKVQGTLDIWENNKNFIFTKIRNINESDNINEDVFINKAPHSAEAMYEFLISVLKNISDEDYRKLGLKILEDNKNEILYFPAGKTVHHDEQAGWLYHVYTMLKSCMALANIYPGLITSILYLGVIVHDIGKLKEMNSDKEGVVSEYSTEGELLGHIALGMEMVSLLGKELNIPREKIVIINHIIASHQPPNLGGLVNTKFLEAEIIKNIDMIDSRVFMFNKAYSSVESGEFTEHQKFLNRCRLFKLTGEKTEESLLK